METAQSIDKKTPVKKTLVILAVVAVVIVLAIVCANTFKNLKGKSSGQEKSTTSFPSVQVTPTPAPLLGPGPYACDPNGICNHYADAIGIGCPKTYADPYCLGACGDTNVRCPK